MKPILDVACGGKMFYFDKHDPRVLFADIRSLETTLCDGSGKQSKTHWLCFMKGNT